MYDLFAISIIMLVSLLPTLWVLFKGRTARSGFGEIIFKSLCLAFCGMIAAGFVTYIYAIFDEVQQCGAMNCAEKLDGPGPAGYMMMQGLGMIVMAVMSFGVNFILCCLVGFTRAFSNKLDSQP